MSLEMKKIVVSSDYTVMSASSLTMFGEISCPTSNAGIVYFKNATDSDIPWEAGEWHSFTSQDISQIYTKGTNGDVVTVIGGN